MALMELGDLKNNIICFTVFQLKAKIGNLQVIEFEDRKNYLAFIQSYENCCNNR